MERYGYLYGNDKDMDTQGDDDMTKNTHQDQRTLMGVLAYLGPLVIIPYFTMRDDAFVKFHVKQGLVLFVIDIILWILGQMFFWQMLVLLRLIRLALVILSIIGIVNVVQKKEKVLPLVGDLAKYFTF